MNIKIFWKLSLLSLFIIPINSCKEENGKNIMVRKGASANNYLLSSNNVTAFTQDDSGVMWIGTSEGLNLFDGRMFKQFFHDESDSCTIPSDNIQVLYKDRRGNIWVGTDNGIARYIGAERYKNYDIGYSLYGVSQIMETSYGALLINNGINVYRFKNDSLRKVYTFENTIGGNQFMNKICPDNKGGMWVLAPTCCQHYNRSWKLEKTMNFPYANLVYLAKDTDFLWLSQSRYLSCIDLNTNKFIYRTPESLPVLPSVLYPLGPEVYLKSDKHGLFKFSLKTKKLQEVTDEELPLKKRQILISALYRDNNRNMWIGYKNAGFQIINQSEIKLYEANTKAISTKTANKNISQLVHTPTGIFGATETQFFFYNISRNTISFSEQSKVFSDSPYFRQDLRKIIAGPNGMLWLLSNVRIVRCSISNGILRVKSIMDPGILLGDCTLEGHTLYVTSDTRFLMSQDYNTGEKDSFYIREPMFNRKCKLLGLSSEKILLFMEGMNLEVFDPKTHQLKKIAINKIHNQGNLIPSFAYEDSQHRIWLGSNRSGLFRLYLSEEKIEKIQSLPTLHVMSMTEDNKGKLWLGTREGVIAFSPSGQSARLYTMKLQKDRTPRQFNEQSVCRFNGDMLLFGSTNGCVVVPPNEMDLDEKPNLNLKEINVLKDGERPISVNDFPLEGNHYTFKYNENDLQFVFGGVNYGNTPVNLYEYKMEGFSPTWSQPSRMNNVSYSNLPPGTYIFRVRSLLSPESLPIEEKSVKITVKVIPWLSWPAIILYFILVASLIYYINILYLRIRTNKMALQMASLDNQREKRTNLMNMSFFANISHEFRNPLTLIAGPITTLRKEEALSQTVQHKLSIVAQSVNRMLVLIDQMLDFNKLENDVLLLQVALFDITNEIKKQLKIFEENAQEHHITLVREGLNNPCYMWLDHDKLEKILGNLFTNALKHTPEGGTITLSCRVMSTEDARTEFHCPGSEGKQMMQIVIRNNGQNIPEEKLKDIFKRYYQVKEINQTHHYGFGNGIGLYYVQRLVTLHHGAIKAVNIDGGMEFRFVLPMSEEAYSPDERILSKDASASSYTLPVTEPCEAVKLAGVKNSYSIGKTKILIVEDDSNLARYLRFLFSDNYNVVNKYDAESALEAMDDIMPDIILSDVVMEEMSGYELCKTLKNNIAYSHIPIVIITAKSNIDEQIEGLKVGANAYVTKPFDPTYLQSLVRSQLRNRDNIRNILKQSTRDDSIAAESLSPQDKTFMTELYDLMEKHISDLDMNLNHICKELHISRSKFNYKIKGLTGETPNNYFKGYKLNKAAKLLKEGRYNVSEVAMLTGFGTLSYFSISFKKQFGVNPSDYK